MKNKSYGDYISSQAEFFYGKSQSNNKQSIKEVANNISNKLNDSDKYKKYISEIAQNGLKQTSPRSARELLKENKGAQQDSIKSFVKQYKNELVKKENEGREVIQNAR